MNGEPLFAENIALEAAPKRKKRKASYTSWPWGSRMRSCLSTPDPRGTEDEILLQLAAG